MRYFGIPPSKAYLGTPINHDQVPIVIPMENTFSDSIPKINFLNRERKDYEFNIVSNKDLLVYNPPTDYSPFRPHRLNFYAVLFIMEGEGKHFIDFKEYSYQKGSVIFIAKDQVHAFEWNDQRKAYFMLFTESFLERSTLGSSMMQQLSLYNYHLHHPVMKLKKKQRVLFTELVMRMKEEYEAPDDWLTEEIILSSMKIFLALAERIRRKRLKEKPRSVFHEAFIDFQNLLQENVLKSRQVQFYADKMMMSTKKLNRITRDVMEKSAKDYINDFLILEMKRLLMNTSLSIKEISYRSGFEEPTNFVKYFKKLVGETPSGFRKREGK
ncbi:MAG: AraC family transcriptional activator of pobA [Nonlabens sp.]